MISSHITDIFSKKNKGTHNIFTHGIKAVFSRNIKILYQYKSGIILEAIATSVAFLLFFYVASLLPSDTITLKGQTISSISFILLGMLCINISAKVLTKSLGSFINEMHQGTFEYISLQPFGLRNYFLAEILFELIYAFIISFVCYTPILIVYAIFQDIQLSFLSAVSLFTLIASYIVFFFSLTLFTATLTLLIKRAKELAYLIMGILQFLSGALFPISFFPTWLKFIAEISPITHFISSLRLIIFTNGSIFNFEVGSSLSILLFCALVTYLAFLVAFKKIFKKLQHRGDFAIY